MKQKKILCRCCNEPIKEEYIIPKENDPDGETVKLTQKNIINLNKKIYGRYLTNYFCINCMCEDLDFTEYQLYEQMEKFKEQGCTLF